MTPHAPISDEAQLLGNAQSEALRRLRRDALDILAAGVRAADPRGAILRRVERRGSLLRLDGVELDLDDFERIFVVGGGKAGAAMAEAADELLGDRISGGVVNIPRGAGRRLGRVELNEASHPLPDEDAVRGVERMLRLVDGARGGDLIVVLLSGGGSALMACPVEGVSLEDLRAVTEALLRSGAAIAEVNAVRKHLSSVAGGQLARRARPATVLSLILSDVVGDRLDTVASGPTAPDPSTFRDALKVLMDYGLWDQAPASVRLRLDAGAREELEPAAKPGDEAFKKVTNLVVANNLTAAQAAVERARALGYGALLLTTRAEGEARHLGTLLGGIAEEVAASGNPLPRRAAIVVGGETTVAVSGSGRGGRNQEVALSAALRIEGLIAVVAALDTDGVDGPTEAAGAVADGFTVQRARALDLSPEGSLRENDSYGFFSALGDVIVTGPTGTNVNDLAVVLVDSEGRGGAV